MVKIRKTIAVIPALNEEKTLKKLLPEVKKYVDEIILIDDFSKDNTSKIARKYARVIKNEKNMGYDACLDKGFKLADKLGAKIIITLDADGQHLPEDIPKFLSPILNENSDLVVGKRPYKARFMEYLFSKYASKKIGISDPLCGMKSYNSKIYKDIGFFDNITSIGTQLLFLSSKKGYKIKEVPIHLKKRVDHSRFGNQIKGNLKLFKALIRLDKYLKNR